ncbi:unnamed protein product [Soboliphyme baturini]|uniref:Peptidase_S9 domain-containing protein n=1 Tax=Soboliphyme baturini TaxID=241478 RepID=A0A183J7Z7_9BILA|nr:unnamed protein product [Soboliphyme baturini]
MRVVASRFCTFTFVWLWLVVPVCVAEVLTVATAIGTASILSGLLATLPYFRCRWYECCEDTWVSPDLQGLNEALQAKLYGQPLVINTIYNALKSHFNKAVHKKALVMSFHGWSGGKV